MNKNLILSSHLANEEYRTFEPSADIKLWLNVIDNLTQGLHKAIGSIRKPLKWLRKYYSTVLEKEVSMKQTALLLETQFAFVMGIFPADMHLLLRMACLTWFAFCLKRCQKSLSKEG